MNRSHLISQSPNQYTSIGDRVPTQDFRSNRLRPRQKAVFESLYPSVTCMPVIPKAEDVFNALKRKVCVQENPSPQIEVENTWAQERSQQYHHDQPAPNPIEEDYDDEETFDRPLVEISPGHFIELRGSKETWKTLQRNFSRQTDCACCSTQIEFIQNVAMVLCPVCRIVIPMDNQNGRGLGLGVKVQSEISWHHSMKDRFSGKDADRFVSKDIKCSTKESVGNLGRSTQRIREPTTNIMKN